MSLEPINSSAPIAYIIFFASRHADMLRNIIFFDGLKD